MSASLRETSSSALVLAEANPNRKGLLSAGDMESQLPSYGFLVEGLRVTPSTSPWEWVRRRVAGILLMALPERPNAPLPSSVNFDAGDGAAVMRAIAEAREGGRLWNLVRGVLGGVRRKVCEWDRSAPWTPIIRVPGTLRIGPGIHIVRGRSGHGKSLLLSLLAGYPIPGAQIQATRFYACRRDLSAHRRWYPFRKSGTLPVRRELCKLYRKVPCIFLPQTLPIVPKGQMTVARLLSIVSDGICAIRGVSLARHANLRKLLRAVLGDSAKWQDDILALLYKDVNALSGGERRRVEVIARLIGLKKLLTPGSVLIMDEPTTGLDEENAREFFRLIETVCDDSVTVLIATHEKESVVSRRSTIFVRRRDSRRGQPLIYIRQRAEA